MKLVNTDLYSYDSDDEEDISFSRTKIKAVLQKVAETSYKPVSSYILTEAAQSLLYNPVSTFLYRERKADISKGLKTTKPKFSDCSFYKFVPSLVVYNFNTSNKTHYTENLFKEFYSRFEKEINVFIETQYLGGLLDLSKDFVKPKSEYEELITSSTDDLHKYYHKTSAETGFITNLKEVLPDLDDILRTDLDGAKKRTRVGQKEIPIKKFQEFLEFTLDTLPLGNFFKFLELTGNVKLPGKNVDKLKNLELFPLLLREELTDLFLVQEVLLRRFDTTAYVESYVAYVGLRRHLSEQAFHEDFYEHLAVVRLNHKIIRYIQKVMGIESIGGGLCHVTEFVSGMPTDLVVKISSNGTRTDFVTLPTKNNSTSYSSLFKGKEYGGTGELEDKIYSPT